MISDGLVSLSVFSNLLRTSSFFPYFFFHLNSTHFIFVSIYQDSEMWAIPNKWIFELSNLLFSFLWAGKSTLLNHLFGTNFREMDAFKGRYVLTSLTCHINLTQLKRPWCDVLIFRSQTTKGIWMARCTGIEPCTIVMDLEGTDGRERGEVLIFPHMLYLGYYGLVWSISWPHLVGKGFGCYC